MKKKTKGSSKIKLFLAGMVQVFFVSSNVYMLAHLHFFGALITSFCLSAVWSYNVKHVAFGDMWDGLSYAAGASMGTISGMFITNAIYS